MGATNCPETPRQKMIAMMYLVYTALLALNVSVEILNGFVTVGDAMNESNKNIEFQLSEAYNLFNEAMANDSTKTVKYYEAAMQVKAYSDSLKTMIDNARYGFLCKMQKEAKWEIHNANGKGGKRTIQLRDNSDNFILENARIALDSGGLVVVDKKDNTDIGTQYFYGLKDKPDGKAIDIKNAIIAYKENVAAIFRDTNLTHDTVNINFGLDVESEFYSEHEKRMVSWERYNFDGAIAVADLVCMSRLKSEVMNAEYDAIKKLFGMIGKEDFKFDQITAICRPSATYIISGGRYELKVNVGAYDSRRVFRAVINGQNFQSGPDGTITYTAGAVGEGQRTVRGTVYMMKDGVEEAYPFDESYFVAAPVAVAELTKMNVVYAGIDNPISVSVPGVASRDVIPTITSGNATITKAPGDGNYIIRATKPGKLTLSVSAKVDKGTKHMGTKEIRIKKIPKPVLKIANFKTGDQVSKVEVTANAMLRAVMEDFDFQLPPLKISSFSFNVSGSGALELTGSGNRLTPEMISRINSAKPRQKIYIDNVRVTTPDGVTHTLDLTLRIK